MLIHFISGQHRLHLADKMWKCDIQLEAFGITKLTGDTGTVSQIVQPVALLYQTCSQARRDIPLQSPCDITSHRASPLLSVQGDTHQTGIRPVAVLAAFGVCRQHAGNVRNYLAGVMTDTAYHWYLPVQYRKMPEAGC